MTSLAGKQALVTGAGSGIGAALCRALAGAGAEVVCTDIDEDAAARTAAALGARSARLDVTDAAAVQAAVDGVVERAGQLDLMFNNAGIVWGGDTELLTLEQWNAIIDINVRGVVHGVAAAYPQMIRQGHGHIVNTASMAGLAAAGQLTSYVMTKHAVVGLSMALRSEAAAHGVGVLAVCPAAVETPILDKGAVGGFVGRDYFLRRAGGVPGRRGDTDPGQGRGRRFRRPRLLPAGSGRQNRLRRRPAGRRHPACHRAQQGHPRQTPSRPCLLAVRPRRAGSDAATLHAVRRRTARRPGRAPLG